MLNKVNKRLSSEANNTKVVIKLPSLVGPNNRKNLKISVFGGLKVYLVIFEFVTMTPKENLVLFDL